MKVILGISLTERFYVFSSVKICFLGRTNLGGPWYSMEVLWSFSIIQAQL